MNQSTPPICPKCHAAIPPGAPLGHCPKCLLQGAATLGEAVRLSSHSASQPTVAEIAPHFPELEVLELIGVGGMGVVFMARQPKLDRLVALKILSRQLADDPAFSGRLDRELTESLRRSYSLIRRFVRVGTGLPRAGVEDVAARI